MEVHWTSQRKFKMRFELILKFCGMGDIGKDSNPKIERVSIGKYPYDSNHPRFIQNPTILRGL